MTREELDRLRDDQSEAYVAKIFKDNPNGRIYLDRKRLGTPGKVTAHSGKTDEWGGHFLLIYFCSNWVAADGLRCRIIARSLRSKGHPVRALKEDMM